MICRGRLDEIWLCLAVPALATAAAVLVIWRGVS
jgi:hypothetical protein